MSDQTGADDGADETAGSSGSSGSFGSSGIRAPWAKRDPAKEDEVRHSALVGFMSVPVHRRFPIRRSTLFMVVAFIGFGALLYLYPASSASTGSGTVVHTANGDFFVPGATKVSPSTTTTTTTRPPATTTTRAPTTTTTTRAGSSTTTSTQAPTSTSTTAVGGSGTTTTTTSPLGSAGTSTTLGGTSTTSP